MRPVFDEVQSMLTIPLREIQAAADVQVIGNLSPDTEFRWMERNSREITPGDLFIAVRGEQFDGHTFVPDAARRGAAAALVSRSWFVAQAVDPPIPLLVVDDPVAALQNVAAARRDALSLKVIGVTGSIGKTSTKEVVAAVVGQRFATYRSPGNMNSELGLPLSLLEVEPGTEIAVLEMGGAYAFGELALLAEIAKPTYAVVTNVHPVHLERMGTIESIAKTKAELVDAIPEDGAAILNGDDHRVRAMANLCRGRVLTYGLAPVNDVWADRVETDGLGGSSFRLHLAGESLHLKIPLVGGHAVELALAAIAVGHAMGMHISEMIPGLGNPGIQVRLILLDGPNGSRIVDDTYNASAPSVLSALGLLHQVGGARKIAVLGDMRELGEVTEEQHRLVGRRAAEVVDHLVTFGPLARIIAEEALDAARAEGRRTPTVTSFDLEQRAELVSYLMSTLRDGDIALLKGSRGLKMEDFVAALQTANENAAASGV
jgi:UDP-N-acetylmuramoyl-tripeptide--D-alanyl-D-alanine ligase